MTFNNLMHPRNIYRTPPNFKQLAADYPEFSKYVTKNGEKYNVDFKNSDALRTLTTVLLKKDFDLSVTIPVDCLIPTVPQRLNYILWIEDLLEMLPKTCLSNRSIDIGTGPCCIFSLLGAKKNGWSFIATEVQEESITYAKRNIESNNLLNKISVVKVEAGTMIKQLVEASDNEFDICMCNPPFFGNMEEFQRKRKFSHERKEKEFLVDGGEFAFVKQIIEESLILKEKVKIYSSMLGRKKSLDELKKHLQLINNIKYTTTEFGQGNTVRWGIAWTFVPVPSFGKVKVKIPRVKSKPGFTFIVPHRESYESSTIKENVRKLEQLLTELQIPYIKLFSVETNAHIIVTAYENTWTNQRQKRRKNLQAKRLSSTSNHDICSEVRKRESEFEVEVMKPEIESHISSELSLKTKTVQLMKEEPESILEFQEPIPRKHLKKFEINKEEPENSTEFNKSFELSSSKPLKAESVKKTHSEKSCDIERPIEQRSPLLNCHITLCKDDDGITYEFTCAVPSHRVMMHQIFLIISKKFLTL